MVAGRQFQVWRLTVLWHGTVLDTVSLRPGNTHVTLRSGDALDVVIADDRVHVSGNGVDVDLVAGGRVDVDGHAYVVDVDVAHARMPHDWSVDSTLLHATMIGVALQVCLLSALWMAPVGASLDAGAGLPSEARRWLSLPGGTAARVGRASFVAAGRRPDEAERVQPERKRGAPMPRRTGQGPSLDQALEAMKAALHPGDGGTLKESLGQLTSAQAQAPQLGAGIGGLAPRDPTDNGPGAGIVGAGTTVSLDLLLRRRVATADAKAETLPKKQQVYPVQMQDVPTAAVNDARIDADPELDPVVREHLTRTVRGRHNVIRGCYEAWGLTVDAKRSGRLVLELTLQPNGRVTDVTTETPPELKRVGECVVRAASEWYLGDVVDQPTRLAFPFQLQPRN
jgi:hypothetical protein